MNRQFFVLALITIFILISDHSTTVSAQKIKQGTLPQTMTKPEIWTITNWTKIVSDDKKTPHTVTVTGMSATPSRFRSVITWKSEKCDGVMVRRQTKWHSWWWRRSGTSSTSNVGSRSWSTCPSSPECSSPRSGCWTATSKSTAPGDVLVLSLVA